VIFEFDEFELDTERFELRRGGETCHVEPQVFDVLRYLVEHRDRVVPKEELLDNVWGDRFVSESALTSRVKAARQALGDTGRAQRMIATAHRRGYRFVAETTERPGVVPVAPAPAPSARCDIRYARSGAVNVAYEITGGGDVDIVLVPGFVSHLEIDWEDPRSADFLERIGRLGRLIRFDKRGTGLSDRPPGLPDLETRMDDVRAVMDAAGSERAILFGYSEGGPMAALFAATYPSRTRALVLFGTYARRTRTDDYPWAPTLEQRYRHAAATESEWGIASGLLQMCPNADQAMAEWWQRRARAAASPGAVRALIEMNTMIDVRDVLPTVRVPTLVLHRVGDTNMTIENGRYVAQHIPGARLVELDDTSDHVPWIGAATLLAPVEAFLEELEAEPPEGRDTVERALATTLFTDIVGSTDMNAAMGDARWSALLDRHDRIAREAIETWDGRWVKSTGDGVLAVFETAVRALRAAIAVRTKLAELGIRIRAGVHASEIETRGDDIAGLGVTIAARLAALGEPGEILVTSTVREIVGGSDVELVARGEHRLKGIPGTSLVYAVAIPEPTLPALRPEPAVATDRPTRNLPKPADQLFGRDDDLARVRDAVQQSRLVTLAGPGGVGKTRLALEYAQESDLDTWFVDLSRVTEPSLVARAFLETLGVSPRGDVPDCDRIVETLEMRKLLLVVDNCEQVVAAATEVVDRICRETPEVRVLATSRQALSVTGEQVLVVAPLALPDESAPPEEQRASDAVTMFCERAERAGADVDDLGSIVRLCRRLDGMPLALELAAARMRAFSAAQILEQLEAGWSVSVSRGDHGAAHHLSLDDAIDWSFRLLDDGERSLLLAMSTFRGPFDLAAAAAVSGCPPDVTADRLAQLVDKSLVQPTAGRAGRRFKLLETVRAFTDARIDESAAKMFRDRHVEYFVQHVETLGARVPGPDEDDATSQLAVELDDVHAAFDHAVLYGDLDSAGRLACGPRLLLTTDGARWALLALRAVDLPDIETHPEYVNLLASAAWGCVLGADLERARTLALRGIEIAGDPAELPRLCWIWPQATGGSFVEGAETCRAGAAVATGKGDDSAASFLLGTAAIYGIAAGDEQRAVEDAQRALELARAIGSRLLRARAAGALTYALQDIDAAAARRAADEVLEIAEPGDFHLNMPRRVLAVLAWREGDYATAVEHATKAAVLIRDQGDRYVQGASIRQLAVLMGNVDPPLAAELLGVADSLVPSVRVIARDAVADEQLRRRLHEELGEDEYAARVETGRRQDIRGVYATVDRALRRIGTGPST
jgi:predicted ATPase/class 3 adenylate cyclase/DNA-binding winged helix-turn-helix (wHTH) protein/pimeloyl-ACP methyl ester carboxylesterase